jgi:hypothetical protein
MKLSFIKTFFIASSFALMLTTLLQTPIVNDVQAAPGGGGGGPPPGAGPVCPPNCPPSPANCDASLIITPTGQTLQFGSFTAGTGGTVVVDTASIRIATGGVVLLTGGTTGAAGFTLGTVPYNCNGRALVIVTAGPTATLTHTTLPAVTMTADTFVTNPAAGGAFDDTVPLTVGATLNIISNQQSGSYQGTYDLTVTFQ